MRNIQRFKPGKIAKAISTRDGFMYPQNEMIQDKVNGQWIHYTEEDEDSINRDWIGKPIVDDISIYPVLPPVYRGPVLRNPYKYGGFDMHMEFNPPTFEYDLHFQHPERVFFSALSTRPDLPNNTIIHGQPNNNPALQAVVIGEQEHLARIPFDMTARNIDGYAALFYHHSRNPPTSLHLGDGDPFNQLDAFTSSGDAIIGGETYHSLYSVNEWLLANYNRAPFTTINLGV